MIRNRNRIETLLYDAQHALVITTCKPRFIVQKYLLDLNRSIITSGNREWIKLNYAIRSNKPKTTH